MPNSTQPLYKIAADQDFEKAFATLAYTELEQKAPGLFPYLVGFQLIKKDDKDTHAIGVFGFHVGHQWYYGPVFWLNGRIKGYELLYIASQDIFVPLQESWINYLTNRQPYILGDAEKRTPTQMGVMAPDFTIFRRSPLLKTSSDIHDEFINADKSAMLKQLTHSEPLTDLIARMPAKCACVLLRHMKEDAKFAEAVYTFYDPKDIMEAVNAAAGRELWKTAEEKPEVKPYVSGKKETVTVLHGDQTDGVEKFKTLTTDEKEKLMTGAVVVQDKRDDRSISEVYSAPEFSKTFQNPSNSGLWRVMLQDGKFETAFVSTSPMSVGDSIVPPCVTLVSLDSKKYISTSSRAVFAKAQLDPSKMQKFYEDLPGPKSMSIGDVGVLIAKDMKVTFPFRVLEVTTGKDGIKSYKVDVQDNIDNFSRYDSKGPYAIKSYTGKDYVEYGYDEYDRGHTIQILPGASKMTNLRDVLVIGDEYTKFFKLGDAKKPAEKKTGDGMEVRRSEDPWYNWKKENKLNLGTNADIDYHLRKLGLNKLSMVYDGHSEMEYSYRGERSRRISPNVALEQLITKVGMREKTASEIIKQARLNGRFDVLVKEAYALSFNQPGAAYDDMYRSAVTVPFEDSIPYPSQVKDREPAPIDDATFRQQASAAAASGQKDVFDVSVLVALARDSRMEDHLASFIKDIIIGNDRIGRILFLYYWHFNKFAEKYGDDDMIELEDLLKEVFKSAGELVLFLKQKSVEPEAVATESVVDL